MSRPVYPTADPTGYPTGYPTWVPSSTTTRTYTPSTTRTHTPTWTTYPPPKHPSNVGAIVGGIIAGVILIALVAAFFVMRRRKKHREANEKLSGALENRNSTVPITTAAAPIGVGSGGDGSGGGGGAAGPQQVPYPHPERQYQQLQQQPGDQHYQVQDPYYAQCQPKPWDYYVESQPYRQNPQYIPVHGSVTGPTSPAMSQITTTGSNLAYYPPPFALGPESFKKSPPGAPHTNIDSPNTFNFPTTKNPQSLTDDPFTIPITSK